MNIGRYISDCNMETDSPLHTNLLKYSSRRILTSSDEEGDWARKDKVDIHSDCADDGTCCSSLSTEHANKQSSSPSQGTVMQPLHTAGDESDPGTVIVMTQAEDSPWDSDADSVDTTASRADSEKSNTSTPGYKRGKHHTPLSVSSHSKGQACALCTKTREVTTGGAGILCSVIKTVRSNDAVKRTTKRRPPSLHLLTNSRVQCWPSWDNVCIVDHHPGWSFQKWISSLRTEIVCISCHTVVIYLEKIIELQDVPP